MKNIYKYTLQGEEHELIEMPIGAKILSAQVQQGEICVWALVDANENKTEGRAIVVIGTGWEINHELNLEFINTVQYGFLVFHIFELTKPV